MITKLIVEITHFDISPDAITQQLKNVINREISTQHSVHPYIEPKPQVLECIMQLIKESLLEDEQFINKIAAEVTEPLSEYIEDNASINISFR